MNKVTEWHLKAMSLIDEALLARKARDHAQAQAFYLEALKWERDAAEAAQQQPSRSILFRSAAWIALEAADPLEAERLAACGLADRGVPNRVRRELREVADEARMRDYHPMAPPSAAATITVHMEGPGITAGGSNNPNLVSRTQHDIISMIYRTAERENGDDFRRRGTSKYAAKLKPRFQQQAASVAISVSIGGGQMELWDENAKILHELFECLELVRREDLAKLKSKIPQEDYFENFYGLARRLAPDGVDITSVDILGVASEDKYTPIRFRKRPRALPFQEPTEELIELIGEIRGADETTEKNTITLVQTDSSQPPSKIQVNHSVLEDIVRPLYGRQVRVSVKQTSQQGKTQYVMIGSPEEV